jgi:hypothetical protein
MGVVSQPLLPRYDAVRHAEKEEKGKEKKEELETREAMWLVSQRSQFDSECFISLHTFYYVMYFVSFTSSLSSNL